MLKIKNPILKVALIGLMVTVAGISYRFIAYWVTEKYIYVLIEHVSMKTLLAPWFSWLLNDLVLYIGILPVFWLCIFLLLPKSRAPLPARTGNGWMTPLRFVALVVICFGFTNLLSLFTTLLSGLIQEWSGIPQTPDASNPLMASTLTNFIFLAIIPPLGEEYVFRYLLRRPLAGAGDFVYMMVSGITFGLFHGNLGQAGFATFAGVLLAWVYTHTGSLIWPILLHFFQNFFGGVFPYIWINAANANPALVPMASKALDLYEIVSYLSMPVAAILLLVYLLRYGLQLTPPTENGWPYKLPRWYYYQNPPIGYTPVPMTIRGRVVPPTPFAQHPAFPQPQASFGAAPTQMAGFGLLPPDKNATPPVGTCFKPEYFPGTADPKKIGLLPDWRLSLSRTKPIAWVLANPGMLVFIGFSIYWIIQAF